jgi:hypothetical protein
MTHSCRASALLAGLALFACSSASVRGGDTASTGRLPEGRRLASYRVTDCRDSAGAAFAHPARVYLVADPDGGEFLVDHIQSYDALVVRNQFTEGADRVFQAVLNDGDRKPVLVDYRLPKQRGDGRMAVASRFQTSESETGELRARVVAVSFACLLRAEDHEP